MMKTVLTAAQLVCCKTSTATFSDEAVEKLNQSLFSGEAEAAEARYKITGFAGGTTPNRLQDQNLQLNPASIKSTSAAAAVDSDLSVVEEAVKKLSVDRTRISSSPSALCCSAAAAASAASAAAVVKKPVVSRPMGKLKACTESPPVVRNSATTTTATAIKAGLSSGSIEPRSKNRSEWVPIPNSYTLPPALLLHPPAPTVTSSSSSSAFQPFKRNTSTQPPPPRSSPHSPLLTSQSGSSAVPDCSSAKYSKVVDPLIADACASLKVSDLNFDENNRAWSFRYSGKIDVVVVADDTDDSIWVYGLLGCYPDRFPYPSSMVMDLHSSVYIFPHYRCCLFSFEPNSGTLLLTATVKTNKFYTEELKFKLDEMLVDQEKVLDCLHKFNMRLGPPDMKAFLKGRILESPLSSPYSDNFGAAELLNTTKTEALKNQRCSPTLRFSSFPAAAAAANRRNSSESSGAHLSSADDECLNTKYDGSQKPLNKDLKMLYSRELNRMEYTTKTEALSRLYKKRRHSPPIPRFSSPPPSVAALNLPNSSEFARMYQSSVEKCLNTKIDGDQKESKNSDEYETLYARRLFLPPLRTANLWEANLHHNNNKADSS